MNIHKRKFGVKVWKLKGEEAMGCLLAIIFGIIYLPIGILSELTKNYK